LEAMIQSVVDVNLRSMHHDISTVTGEELVIFTLSEVPNYRDGNLLSGPSIKNGRPPVRRGSDGRRLE
jgi:hypothetical protein